MFEEDYIVKIIVKHDSKLKNGTKKLSSVMVNAADLQSLNSLITTIVKDTNIDFEFALEFNDKCFGKTIIKEDNFHFFLNYVQSKKPPKMMSLFAKETSFSANIESKTSSDEQVIRLIAKRVENGQLIFNDKLNDTTITDISVQEGLTQTRPIETVEERNVMTFKKPAIDEKGEEKKTPEEIIGDAIRQILNEDLIKTYILRKLNAKAHTKEDRIRKDTTITFLPKPDFEKRLKDVIDEHLLRRPEEEEAKQ